MEAKPGDWEFWSNKLHGWGLQNLAISLLEGSGPLTILAAQLFYLSQPFLNLSASRVHLEALANMLEDTRETKKFVDFLRESSQK